MCSVENMHLQPSGQKNRVYCVHREDIQTQDCKLEHYKLNMIPLNESFAAMKNLENKELSTQQHCIAELCDDMMDTWMLRKGNMNMDIK